jgi:hypothetical protein
MVRRARTIRGPKREASPLSFASITITLVAILSLFSVIVGNSSTISFRSPTITHTGYFAVGYTGVYHYVDAQPFCAQSFPPCLVPSSEVVFYLTTENATIQLVFYCGADYCYSAQQLPFKDGDRIYVKGTLLRPSEWPTNEYQPTLRFFGDLYVFNYYFFNGFNYTAT